jgi:hypothetical protein
MSVHGLDRRSRLVLPLAGATVISAGLVGTGLWAQQRGSESPVPSATAAVGPAAVDTVLANGDYRVRLRVSPNGNDVNRLSVDVRSSDGRPVGGRVAVATTMTAMRMGWIPVPVRPAGAGSYGGKLAFYRMPGLWDIRVRVTPPKGAPFAVRAKDTIPIG